MLQTLPTALNAQALTAKYQLANAVFNSKLAVTTSGSRYPRHYDNAVWDNDDVRKLTTILYLNPNWKEGDGGEIRLFVKNDEGGDATVKTVDLSPVGGRLLLFWSDEIPHEVLRTRQSNECVSNKDTDAECLTYSEIDRYALTVWIHTNDKSVLHNNPSFLNDLVHFG